MLMAHGELHVLLVTNTLCALNEISSYTPVQIDFKLHRKYRDNMQNKNPRWSPAILKNLNLNRKASWLQT